MIREYFAQLGLEREVASLYLALYRHGAQSISELARSSGIERTRIYRMIDMLKSTNLVEVEVRYKRSVLRAAPLDNVHILLAKKEEELQALRGKLPQIQQTLQAHEHAANPIKVQLYTNVDGIKQMLWNETRSKTEKLALLYENMQGFTNSAFFERWVREENQKGNDHRGLIGDHFLETQKKWYAHKDNERLGKWESRYVPTTLFPITHSMVIYNDVVAYYNFQDGSVFGVEIYNEQIATTQRAFFETLWQQATPIDRSISQQLKPGVYA